MSSFSLHHGTSCSTKYLSTTRKENKNHHKQMKGSDPLSYMGASFKKPSPISRAKRTNNTNKVPRIWAISEYMNKSPISIYYIYTRRNIKKGRKYIGVYV